MELDSFESRLTQVEGINSLNLLLTRLLIRSLFQDSMYGSTQPQALYTRLSNIVESHKSYTSMTHELDSLMTTFSTVIMNKRTSIDQLTQRIYELIQDKSHIEQLVRSVETILAHEHVVYLFLYLESQKFTHSYLGTS